MKQPQFDKLTIHTPLWRDNAESLRAIRAARFRQLNRASFPILVILAGLAVARLVTYLTK